MNKMLKTLKKKLVLNRTTLKLNQCLKSGFLNLNNNLKLIHNKFNNHNLLRYLNNNNKLRLLYNPNLYNNNNKCNKINHKTYY